MAKTCNLLYAKIKYIVEVVVVECICGALSIERRALQPQSENAEIHFYVLMEISDSRSGAFPRRVESAKP